MKIISMVGNYTSGTRIVQQDSGIIEKQSLFVVAGLPTYSVQKMWLSFEEYIESTKQKPIDLDKVFKNW